MKSEELINLVIARLETMPNHVQVNLGNEGTLDKSDLISHVKKQDSLGKKIVDMQLAYLKSLKNI